MEAFRNRQTKELLIYFLDSSHCKKKPGALTIGNYLFKKIILFFQRRFKSIFIFSLIYSLVSAIFFYMLKCVVCIIWIWIYIYKNVYITLNQISITYIYITYIHIHHIHIIIKYIYIRAFVLHFPNWIYCIAFRKVAKDINK